MHKKVSPKIVSLVFGVLVLCFAIGFYAVGWSEPLQGPPGCTPGDPGCDPPINVGPVGQNKEGNLTIGGSGGVGLLEAVHSAFFATVDGNVGIGTTTPGAKLEVEGKIRGDLDCRKVISPISAVGPAIACCAADEYLVGGGAQCETGMANVPMPGCAGQLGFLHDSYPCTDNAVFKCANVGCPADADGRPRGWTANCYDANLGGDGCVQAFAICCKK